MRVLVACEYSGRVRDAFISRGHDAMSCDLLAADSPGPHYRGDISLLLKGWKPVAFSSDMPDCEWCGDAFCLAHEDHYSDCDCIGPTQDGIEYMEANGQLFGRPTDSPRWDLMIAHPPCTYLTCSAEWAYSDLPIMIKGKPKNLDPKKLYGPARREARDEAEKFFMMLQQAPIDKIAIENPVGVMSSRYRKGDQTINPYQFGEDASKRTCLWLKNLPNLKGTDRFKGRSVEWPKGSGKMVERWGNQTDSGQSNLTPSSDRWKQRSYTYQGWADAMAKQWG